MQRAARARSKSRPPRWGSPAVAMTCAWSHTIAFVCLLPCSEGDAPPRLRARRTRKFTAGGRAGAWRRAKAAERAPGMFEWRTAAAARPRPGCPLPAGRGQGPHRRRRPFASEARSDGRLMRSYCSRGRWDGGAVERRGGAPCRTRRPCAPPSCCGGRTRSRLPPAPAGGRDAARLSRSGGGNRCQGAVATASQIHA